MKEGGVLLKLIRTFCQKCSAEIRFVNYTGIKIWSLDKYLLYALYKMQWIHSRIQDNIYIYTCTKQEKQHFKLV